MRPWQILTSVSLLAFVIVFSTAMTTHFTQGRVPVVAGSWMAVLLCSPIGVACLVGFRETTPAERRRTKEADPLGIMAGASMGMSAGLSIPALVWILWAGQWVLLPTLLVGSVALVIASVTWRKERGTLPEPPPDPTRKLAGMPAHARLPYGWIPVYVHRPGGRYRDMLVDYRVHVDGARVGELAPGRTLLIGLGAGAHTIQGRMTGGSSPTLNLRLSEGRPVHLVLEPNGSDLEAVTLIFTPGAYLRISHWERPGAGPATDAQGPYP
ncbi:hypothetical protein [Nocardiopsis listeri]|uniref:hypothetical protein n=1 Tax=Nocardiopsis listeri TaxID=53440 RepID=UPI000829D5F5|nr:hypothetical protein [Nocardiopsis listeri]